ncbi:hypothetical protein [Actinomadura formosensis]|uniref:hypothetical protein n=1 Tax=Actinomadura formosensis TaxID=60706 RepID=UPI003D8E4ED4
MTKQPNGLDLDLDLFFATNRFPTPATACDALANDIVTQYPAAKRLSSLDQVRTVLPYHPAGGFQYHSPADGPVLWQLAECGGRCRRTRRATKQMLLQNVNEQLKAHFSR